MKLRNIKKETLHDLIFVQEKAYEEIGRMYKCTGSAVRKRAKTLGIVLPSRRAINPKESFNKGKRTVPLLLCLNCQKETGNKKYCNNTCQQEYSRKTFIKNYYENQHLFVDLPYTSKTLKDLVLKEQNFFCNICFLPNLWMGKPLTLILDHIDGNAHNQTRKNLRCICSNCDSQLPTYKSKNKNSARRDRYLRNYKN